jgi:MFS superfamily sulfate permease-like transporter
MTDSILFWLAVATVVLFAAGMLRNLPQPVLAAIVLAAVMGLVDLAALRHIWHFSRAEFLVTMAALAGVLGSGPVNGALIGAILSVVLLLRQAARPRVTELVRARGGAGFVDPTGPGQTTPGVMIVRCESSLLYFNTDHVRERLLELLARRTDPVSLVVFDLSAVPRVDLAGATLLAELLRTLRARRIALRVAAANGDVRDALHRIGFEREYGSVDVGQTVDGIVSAWLGRQSDAEAQRHAG